MSTKHDWHPIARWWERGMVYRIWVQTLIHILLKSLQFCMQYCVTEPRHNGTWLHFALCCGTCVIWFDRLVQDCSNSSVSAMELLQSCTKPSGQGAIPVRGAPGWLALSPVRGMREPTSGSIQLQKLQFQSVIYGNPEHSNWHQSIPTHIWLLFSTV